MRRLTAAMAVTCLVTAPVIGGLASSGPALAQSEAPSEPPEGEQPAPEPVPGQEVCTAADPRLQELSGLVALEDGYVVVNDSTEFEDRLPIFFLDGSCNVVDQQGFAPGRPRDPEDMALDREANVLWVGDTGDNAAGGTGEGEVRPTVALWRIELDGDRTPLIHRFTYPDAPQDAEALLLAGDGTPIIVTKQVGAAQLFIPTELRPSSGPDDAVPLEAVGEFTPQDTEADHDLGQVAEQVVTGGANAPDNSKVVLRTYTDAYEFDVTDGDVVAAVTEGEPRITPLPGEPLGEAISYTADGSQLVTISEVPEGADFTPVLLSYTPVTPPPPEDSGGGAAAPAAGSDGGGGSLFDSVQDIINVIAAVGVIGVVLVAAGVFGIVRARRRGGGGGGDGGPGGPGGPGGDGPVTGRARLTGESPDQQAQGWAPEQPAGVYTSQAAREPEYGHGGGYAGSDYGGAGEYQGSEYGGGQYGGGQYGGEQYSGGQYSGGHGGEADYGYGGGDPYRQGYQDPPPGYSDQPYDQDQNWTNGHREQAQGYQGQAYESQGYAGQDYQGGYPDQAYGQSHEGGNYSGGTYQSAPADDYANDPDYSYEFRQQQQGRWQ